MAKYTFMVSNKTIGSSYQYTAKTTAQAASLYRRLKSDIGVIYTDIDIKIDLGMPVKSPVHKEHGIRLGYYYGLCRAIDRAFSVEFKTSEQFLNSTEAREVNRIINLDNYGELKDILRSNGYTITVGERDSWGPLTWIIRKVGENKKYLVVG